MVVINEVMWVIIDTEFTFEITRGENYYFPTFKIVHSRALSSMGFNIGDYLQLYIDVSFINLFLNFDEGVVVDAAHCVYQTSRPEVPKSPIPISLLNLSLAKLIPLNSRFPTPNHFQSSNCSRQKRGNSGHNTPLYHYPSRFQ